MEIIPEGKNFRLANDDELPRILETLEKYLPHSIKVRCTDNKFKLYNASWSILAHSRYGDVYKEQSELAYTFFCLLFRRRRSYSILLFLVLCNSLHMTLNFSSKYNHVRIKSSFILSVKVKLCNLNKFLLYWFSWAIPSEHACQFFTLPGCWDLLQGMKHFWL